MIEVNLLFGISLTASFLAGVLALFAPCCITFLFPAYLGTIFKEGKKVIFYTIVFALGLSFILVPVALGFRFFVFLFDQYHKQIYYFGTLILILMGIATIKPFFSFPRIFHLNPQVGKKVNVGSIFSLGLFSGLTSACCAPVLFAAVALTTLSPTTFQAVIVSLAYVLGIVFPLFILSLFYKNITQKFSGDKRQQLSKILTYIGGVIFIAAGVLIAVFNYLGKIQMYQTEDYARSVRLFVSQFGRLFQNPIIDITAFVLILIVFIKLLKKREKEQKGGER
ncbi:cytochrome c biogenesis protein CcdA [Candidatus Roizmanbacteria bacterium]|nr:cytochrome c biogenesis protein CcdA [Candidatus Roizmanbacteria bacterium]